MTHATLVNIKKFVPIFIFVVQFHHFLTQKKNHLYKGFFWKKTQNHHILKKKDCHILTITSSMSPIYSGVSNLLVTCSQIWLSPFINVYQFTYFTILKKKPLSCAQLMDSMNGY
jgi:hypothetical protein